MGTVSFSASRPEWSIGPIDFTAADVVRLAEYFDGSIEQIGSFLRETWLPDASRTLQALIRESGRASEGHMAFLCDHLREGARSVGASAIVRAADQIESAVRAGRYDPARALAAVAIRAISHLSLQLAA